MLAIDTPARLVARAGCCLDIECSSDARAAIHGALSGIEGILRVVNTLTGLTLFIDGHTMPDCIIRKLLAVSPINGFRVRGADLAEVFNSLTEATI
jgi:hypothetical protein